MPPELVIIGASTRAAAHSALRGGLRPICVDLYGDADLQSVAEVITIDDYPSGLPELVARLPACPWMYTGGLENHPAIVARIAESRRLLGNSRDVLKRIRDPWWLARTLDAANLPRLELWPTGSAPPPTDGRWLRKPLRGAGGRGIGVWSVTSPASREAAYFQRYARGDAFSALYLARADRSRNQLTELLSVTRQLIGLREIFAPPFAWCGSVIPATLPARIVDLMRRIGEQLAITAGLQGLFGCDFIVEEGVPMLTEVNPRYTAAMELVDYQMQTSLVARHVAACDDTPFSLSSAKAPSMVELSITRHSDREDSRSRRDTGASDEVLDRSCAKLILFADRELIARDATALLIDPREGRLPFVADVPNPGQRVAAGAPVCTLFAEGQTEAACFARLMESVSLVRDYFRPIQDG